MIKAILNVSFGSGHIQDAIFEATKLANKLGIGVRFEFNGVTVFVAPGDNPIYLYVAWRKFLEGDGDRNSYITARKGGQK